MTTKNNYKQTQQNKWQEQRHYTTKTKTIDKNNDKTIDNTDDQKLQIHNKNAEDKNKIDKNGKTQTT